MTEICPPTNEAVAEALGRLATVAKIKNDPHELFVKRLSEVIWSAWKGGYDQGRKARGITSGIVGATKLTDQLYDVFADSLNHMDEEDAAEYRESVAKLRALAEYHDAEAQHSKLCLGGQSRSLTSGNATSFDRFVADVLTAIREVGGNLTVNRNSIEWGTLPKFLNGLEPILPPGLVPKAMSPRALERIKAEVDDEYPKAG